MKKKPIGKKLIGLRSFKTIIAVVVAYLIAYYVDGLNPAMMSAGAITAMDTSMADSFKSGFRRILTNIMAISTAFILQAIDMVNPIGVAIGMTFIVVVCNIFSIQNMMGTATIFFVFVLDVPYTNKNLETHAINRIVDTTFGTIIGIFVNAFLFRPRQEKYLLQSYRKTYLDLRNGLKDLIEEDKSVNESALIESVADINDNYKKLREDIKLKMSQGINTVTVAKLNNLFRTALSLIIELNEIESNPIISKKNERELAAYFKGDFYPGFEIGEPESEFDQRYNYELTKLVHTLESIEYNLYEYTKSYEKTKDKWYLEGKE